MSLLSSSLCFREQQLSRAIFVTDGPITDQDEGVSAFHNYVTLKTKGGDNAHSYTRSIYYYAYVGVARILERVVSYHVT